MFKRNNLKICETYQIILEPFKNPKIFKVLKNEARLCTSVHVTLVICSGLLFKKIHGRISSKFTRLKIEKLFSFTFLNFKGQRKRL